MISLNDAAAMGVTRLRKPIWANPLDHLQIHIHEGSMGPWIKLWSPYNPHCNGRDPVQFLCIEVVELEVKCFEPYTGALPDSDEYRAAIAKYDDLLQGKGELADAGRVRGYGPRQRRQGGASQLGPQDRLRARLHGGPRAGPGRARRQRRGLRDAAGAHPMKIEYTKLPSYVEFDPKDPLEVTLTATKADEHTMLLAFLGACDHPGMLNRMFNRLIREVTWAKQESSRKANDGMKKARKKKPEVVK
jgi:hypothetical protein